jgi:hypothetical protein
MSLELIVECRRSGSTTVDATTSITITEPGAEPPENIKVLIKKIEAKSFVPLGIKNTAKERRKSSDKIKIMFEIKNKPATECYVKISYKNPKFGIPFLLWEEHIAERPIGEHTYEWDGFDINGRYNSRDMSEELVFEVTAKSADGDESTAEKEARMKRKVEWLDVLITKTERRRRIAVILRVKFKDGGAKGLGLGGKIPQTARDRDGVRLREAMERAGIRVEGRIEGRDPLSDRTRDFERLRGLAIEGVSRHWGRNDGNSFGKHVRIANENNENEEYQVFVNAIDRPNPEKKHLKEIKLIFNTNKKPMRSRNLGRLPWPLSVFVKMFPGRAVYHAGYIRHSKEWFYWADEDDSEPDFKYTVAHEIGHEILQEFRGIWHSYRHKGSTTIVQTRKKRAPSYPNEDEDEEEIDLMKYHKDDRKLEHYRMYVATEEDVLNLIWLIRGDIV